MRYEEKNFQFFAFQLEGRISRKGDERESEYEENVGRDEKRGFGRTIVLCMLRAWISIARAGNRDER